MEFCKISSLALLCLVLGFSHARSQDSPKDYVDGHNRVRAEVGVGPVMWDEKVAAYARNYSNQRAGDCQLVHSDGPFGENIAWSSGNLWGTEAVEMWFEEKADYNYKTDSCMQDKMCGHYTQMVWRNTTRIGCAKVICSNNGGTFISCNYDPAGNYDGVKPY